VLAPTGTDTLSAVNSNDKPKNLANTWAPNGVQSIILRLSAAKRNVGLWLWSPAAGNGQQDFKAQKER
jgi:hypothetical protein